jgi:hypothetical protein
MHNHPNADPRRRHAARGRNGAGEAPHAAANGQPDQPDLTRREGEDDLAYAARQHEAFRSYLGAAEPDQQDREDALVLTPKQRAQLRMSLPDAAVLKLGPAEGPHAPYVTAAVRDHLAMSIFGDCWSSRVLDCREVYQGPDNKMARGSTNLVIRHTALVEVTVYGPNGASQSHTAGGVSSAVAEVGDWADMDRAWQVSYNGAITAARRNALGLFGQVFGGLVERDRDGLIQAARASQESRARARQEAPRQDADIPPAAPADAEPAWPAKTIKAETLDTAGAIRTNGTVKAAPAPSAADRSGDPAAETSPNSAPSDPDTAHANAGDPSTGGRAPGTNDGSGDTTPSADAAPHAAGTKGRYTLYEADGRKAFEANAEMFESGLLGRVQKTRSLDELLALDDNNLDGKLSLPDAARQRIDAAMEARSLEVDGDAEAADAPTPTAEPGPADTGGGEESPARDPEEAAPADAGASAKQTPAGKPAAKASGKPGKREGSPWPKGDALPDLPAPENSANAYQSALIKAIGYAPSAARLDRLESDQSATIAKHLSKSGQRVVAKCFESRRRELESDA